MRPMPPPCSRPPGQTCTINSGSGDAARIWLFTKSTFLYPNVDNCIRAVAATAAAVFRMDDQLPGSQGRSLLICAAAGNPEVGKKWNFDATWSTRNFYAFL